MPIVYALSEPPSVSGCMEDVVVDTDDGVPRTIRHGTTLKHSDESLRTQAGIWECEACDWLPMVMGERAEFFHVVQGAIVVQEDGQEPIEVAIGMSVYSPPGWTGRFRVPVRMVKSFVSFYPAASGSDAVPQ